ncbi:hypothetical protein PPL_02789 [Heterostelium album PN500]|uniref:Uncharacterized protein n=1 Tax=Heterostelium pallidum (strain ATCC 26659 / Pp 5 / PN500) TaxID=670386 RepID=D3B324_HETP5|nr:hypothetical protein PPL_02789 [Heterostelium album PN500]EFA83722.1 hypothetical protein PPL_02789 [Heterostelium album PN500]|eukprot:XP_020435839.1 hypothetical protein PPL_02789 [Heterostelium album PN500]
MYNEENISTSSYRYYALRECFDMRHCGQRPLYQQLKFCLKSGTRIFLLNLLFFITIVAVCNAAVPTVFYVPHQDDEALGMPLGIPEHIAAGRPVKVILYMPNRSDPGLLDIMNGVTQCPLNKYYASRFPGHPAYHNFNMNQQQMNTYRNEEFSRSVGALGLSTYSSTGWGDAQESQLVSLMYNLILKYEKIYPGTGHKCIAGPSFMLINIFKIKNRDCFPWDNPPKPMVDHIACYKAALLLKSNYPNGINGLGWDFRFYDDYIWFDPVTNENTYYTYTTHPEPPCPQYTYGAGQYMGYKINSQNAYKVYTPSSNRYALGMHSVPNLFYGSQNDPYIYLELLEPGNNPPCKIQPYNQTPRGSFAKSIHVHDHDNSHDFNSTEGFYHGDFQYVPAVEEIEEYIEFEDVTEQAIKMFGDEHWKQ